MDRLCCHFCSDTGSIAQLFFIFVFLATVVHFFSCKKCWQCLYKIYKKRKSMKLENVIGCILWLIPASSVPAESFASRAWISFPLCPQAVILCVHLWMCMKNTVDDRSVVVKRSADKKALWSTCWDEGAGAAVQAGHTHTHTPTGLILLTGPAPSTRWASPEHLANTSELFSRLVLLEAHWQCFCASGTNVFRGAWCRFNRCSECRTRCQKKKRHRVLLYSLCLMRWWR